MYVGNKSDFLDANGSIAPVRAIVYISAEVCHYSLAGQVGSVVGLTERRGNAAQSCHQGTPQHDLDIVRHPTYDAAIYTNRCRLKD